jgi:hypothetical protein
LTTTDRLPAGDLGLFSGKLFVVPLARGGKQRRRERLGELEFGSAIRAGDRWFGHCWLSRIATRIAHLTSDWRRIMIA